jgi:hypothetical protein
MRLQKTSWVLLTLVVALAVVWLVKSAGFSPFREEEYRDTGDLSVNNVTWHSTEDGYRIRGVLVNRNRRSASSVVLVGEVRDLGNGLVAANPLINLLAVPAGGSKPLEAFVPAEHITDEVKVSVRPILVRWEE